jgi:hypothetical protein
MKKRNFMKATRFYFASIGIEGEETECFFVTNETGETFCFELPFSWMKDFLTACGKNINEICLSSGGQPVSFGKETATSFAYRGKIN